MAATQKEIVDAVALALQNKNLSQQAVAVIHRSTEKVLKRLQQDVGAKVKEDGDDVVEAFCHSLASKLGNMSQNWYDGIKNELIVYPEGTRFIYRDGNATVIVIEQPPAARTVDLGGSLRYLAFPYVVFVLGFNNGQWNGLCDVAVRIKPMTSLDDDLSALPLPNISGYRVCMGGFKVNPRNNMTEQSNAIIGSFWQSQFGALDGTVLTRWERKTKADPLYVLHETYGRGGPLRSVVSAISKNAGERPDIVHTLKQEIVQAVGTIGAEIQKTMLSLDMVKQNKEKVHIETLDEILKEIIVQAYAELWEYLQAQLQRERAKMQQEMVALLKKKTGYDSEYERVTKWNSMMTTNTVKASLERIRAEAIRKARQGIAEKRSKSNIRVDPVDDVLRKLQVGVNAPAAREITNKVCRRVVDRFLTIFQDGLNELQVKTVTATEYPASPRNTAGEIVLYPEGCRFSYLHEDGNGVMVIEQPPQVRTLLIDMHQKYVPLPYVIFVVYFTQRSNRYNYGGINIGFRTEPMKSITDVLYNPTLPNFTGHTVCMGSYDGGDPTSAADVADHVISTFWQSVFADNFHHFRVGNTTIKTWAQWEAIGQKNPLDILKAKFPVGNRINDLLRPGKDTQLSKQDRRNLTELVAKTWNKVAAELDANEAQTVVHGAAQEILNELLRDMALQPQNS